MKRFVALVLAVMFALSMVSACAEETETAKLVSAKWITQVLEWGETVTGVRFEYDDEIFSGDLQPAQFPTYSILTTRTCKALYCNNSGKLGDAQAYGKYVFYEFAIADDFVNYTDYITFNESSKVRERLSAVYAMQQHPLRTKSGKTVPAQFVSLKNEIRYEIDKFITVDHPYTVNGESKPAQYHLYIPEEYDANGEALPLIVHFGHDTYTDYTGNLYGTLIANNSCTVWAEDDFQARHTAFVVTVGALAKPAMEVYKEVVDEICSTYNIDTSRIYGVSYAGSTKNFWTFIETYPDVLAAGFVASPGPVNDYGGAENAYAVYKNVISTLPMWTFNGLNDLRNAAKGMLQLAEMAEADGLKVAVAYGEEGEGMWNGLLREDEARELADSLMADAAAIGADDMMTIYVPSTILFTDHWSWACAFNNPGVQDWLMSQVNDAPYVIEK